MHTKIQNILFKLYDITTQLDVLYKRTFGDILSEYTYTEMHCIDCIGKIENPNVTKIANTMKLTKAAISKTIKKLILKKSIEIYRNSNNKKEIYYKLTKIGKEVYDKHLILHENWCKKDEKFFAQFNKRDIETTYNLLVKYTKSLEERLDKMNS